MSVTVIRQPRRRSKKDQAHDSELARLGSKAAQVRYACEVVAAQPGPMTVQVVRLWLAEHGVAENPADTKRRTYVSRIVNDWRREQGLDATTDAPSPTGGPTAGATEEPTDTEAPASTRAGASTVAPPDPAPTPDPVTVADVPALLRAHLPATVPATVPAAPHPDVIVAEHTAATVTRAVARAAEPLTPAPTQVPADLRGSQPRAGASTPEPHLVKRARRLRLASYLVLSAVAAAGAALSYQSLQSAAADVFPHRLAQVFPLLVDALIVGASLAYLAGAVIGRGRAGWRLTAHVGVGGTIFLNALAADTLLTVPWHIAAPIVWSALVELTARDLLGDYRAAHARPDSIPFALWLTAPGESASTWLRVRRQAAHASVRADVGAHAAAREALRMALPGRGARKVRRVISRQLRAGSITPAAVLAQAVTIMGTVPAGTPQAVLRDVLANAVTPVPGQTPRPAAEPRTRPRARCRTARTHLQDSDHLQTVIRARQQPHSAAAPGGADTARHRPNPAPRAGQRNPYIGLPAEAEQQPENPT